MFFFNSSIFPGLTRLIQMYLPLKSYFLSIDEPPKVIKQFFENEISEVYV